jgi:uncharacterized protein YjiS (DUF1127 family)
MLLKSYLRETLAGRPRPLRNSSWLGRVAFWLDRARQRRALAELDDRGLSDIGLSRADVVQEIHKPFWR